MSPASLCYEHADMAYGPDVDLCDWPMFPPGSGFTPGPVVEMDGRRTRLWLWVGVSEGVSRDSEGVNYTAARIAAEDFVARARRIVPDVEVKRPTLARVPGGWPA